MDTNDQDKPKPRPLGNESPDPFSPALPPGSLHEILRQEEDDPSGEPSQAMDDPDAEDPRKERRRREDEGGD